MFSRYMVKWIKDNKIVEALFDKKQAHDALLSQSKKILEFLAKRSALTNDHAEAIWQCVSVCISEEKKKTVTWARL